jgi:hypothetical protein
VCATAPPGYGVPVLAELLGIKYALVSGYVGIRRARWR